MQITSMLNAQPTAIGMTAGFDEEGQDDETQQQTWAFVHSPHGRNVNVGQRKCINYKHYQTDWSGCH